MEKIEPAVKLLDKYNRPYDVVDTNFVKSEHSWKLMEEYRNEKG